MTERRTTEPRDPRPGDLDVEIARLAESEVQRVDGVPREVVSTRVVGDDDATRLGRTTPTRDEHPAR